MELHPFLEHDNRPAAKWWYVLSATGESPSMRVGHSATFVPALHPDDEHNRVFIIGGANPSQVFNEVYVLDLCTRSWDTQEASGFRGRYEHAAFRVDNHPTKVFVFGGATQAGSLNDVQSLDVCSGCWSDVETTGTAPSPRTHRSVAIVGPKAYFYSGGHSGPDPVGDRRVHCLDTTTMNWCSLTPRGDSPKPRHGHVMIAHNNQIFLHGGMAGSTFYDDLHILDLDRNTWSSVKKKRVSPPPRAAHDVLLHDDAIHIFGGMSRTGALDDAYKLVIENKSWSKLENEGPAPANRLDFALCTIKLSVPKRSLTHQEDEEEDACVLSDTSTRAREVLDRELKPGSASSRDSVSDSTNVDEALYSLDTEPSAQGQQPSKGDGASGEDNQQGSVASDQETEEVTMVFINGGMDTEGEIFDDTLVTLL